jgi:hypothetical protein
MAVVLLKLVIFALDLSVMAMLLAARRGPARPGDSGGWGILAYGWNPMILITVPLAGAADVALGAAFLGAYLARRRGRMGLATVLLTLAALVKAYAAVGLILHLVLLAREQGVKRSARHAAAAVGVSAAAYAPYWAGWATLNGLLRAISLTNQSFTGTIERLVVIPLLRLTGIHPATAAADAPVRYVIGALLAAVFLWAVRRVWRGGEMWHTAVVVLVVYLYLTPWFLYWYTVAPLILAVALPRERITLPLLIFSCTSLFLTPFDPQPLSLLVQTTLRFVPPMVAYALEWDRRSILSGATVATIRIPATAATTREKSVAQ